MLKNNRAFVIFVWVILLFVFIGVLLLCVFIFSGSPDSPLVDIVGQDLNFVEYKKTGTVSIPKRISTIIYFKKTSDLYKEAGDSGDKSYLILKELSDGTEKIIFQGNLGHQIQKAILDKENQLIFYTSVDWRDDLDNTYMITFSLETMQIVNKLLIVEWSETHVEYLSEMIFDEANRNILFRIYYRLDPMDFDSFDYKYLSYNIHTKKITTVSKTHFYERVVDINNKTTFVFEDDDYEKHLFSIFPEHSFLLNNYKTKYNGFYLNDGTENIRLTKDERETGPAIIWLDDGKYVITGPYLYDTSGKTHELRIADGDVLVVY